MLSISKLPNLCMGTSGTPHNMYLSIVWVCSFTEPDLFDNNVPFDNTTLIYLINLLWKLGLDLRVALT